MADLKIPGVGPVNKKAAIVAGVVGAVVLVVAYTRHKNSAAASSAAADTSTADSGGASNIDPTTGFPYGSAQDTQALDGGGQLGDLGGIGGGGNIDPSTGFPYGSAQDLQALGVTTPSTPTAPTTVAEWEQEAISDLSAGGVSQAVIKSATSGLPRYLAGLTLTPDQASAVQIAVGLAGEPPGGPYTIKRAPAPPVPVTHEVTADGHDDLHKIATENHITEAHIVALNLNLAHLVGTGKPVPKGTKVKV